MNKAGIEYILSTKKDIEQRYMMGSTAIHLLGDISRGLDLFLAYAEVDEYWVGAWVTGFGFFDVLFPKNTSRYLTPDEVKYWSNKAIQIGSNTPQKIKVN